MVMFWIGLEGVALLRIGLYKGLSIFKAKRIPNDLRQGIEK